LGKELQAESRFSLSSICIKAILVHTVTYFVIGVISFTVFDYSAKYADPMLGNYMRQTNHPLVAAGTLFQVLRGFLFGLVFYWLREIVFTRKNGWLVLWLTLLIVGVISPFGPSPSSIEGMLYTTVPLNFHLIGLPEVAVQSLLLAFFTHYWVRHPEKKWLGWLFGIAFFVALLMAVMGILASLGRLPTPAG
jgi:hypothetical protein